MKFRTSGMSGLRVSFQNLIMHLTEAQFEQCRRNFGNLHKGIAHTARHFY